MTAAQKSTKANNELVAYRLNQIDEKLTALDKKIDHNFVAKDVYASEMGNVKDDIKYIKNLVYGTVGTLIALILAAVVSGKFLP